MMKKRRHFQLTFFYLTDRCLVHSIADANIWFWVEFGVDTGVKSLGMRGQAAPVLKSKKLRAIEAKKLWL